MDYRLQVRTTICTNGERVPTLVNSVDGLPLFSPTVYITSMVRGKGDQAATCEAHLRAIMFLYNWGMKEGIDIDARFRAGEFLRLHEIEALAAEVRTRADNLLTGQESSPSPEKVVSLEARKRKQEKKNSSVSGGTAANRFRYIRDYLDWLAFHRLGRVAQTSPQYGNLAYARTEMKKAFDTRVPSGSSRNDLHRKLGLTHAHQERLLAVVDPNSPDNPWTDIRVRYRNQLLVRFLLFLGVRKGEALSIELGDVDTQQNMVTIHRTPNDPEDDRLHKPQAKTRARRLPLDESMVRLFLEYIKDYRCMDLPGARKKKKLFLETKLGKGLSIGAANDIFKAIQGKAPDLPKNLSAHLLRHTWNDRFSEMSDEKLKSGEWTDEQERKMRCGWMGWVLDSQMAWHYSQRHITEKAHQAGLKLQKELLAMTGETAP